MPVSVWGYVAPITRNEKIPLAIKGIHYTLSHVKTNKTWPWILKNHYRQTFLLRNKIRNSEPRFGRKAKEFQTQLGVKVPYIKKNV